MSKLPDIFLRERYEKDIKYITVYDVYTPNYNSKHNVFGGGLVRIRRFIRNHHHP